MADDTGCGYTRRRFLGTTIGIASGPSLLLPREAAADEQQKLRTYNGDTDPYPIPWLDKNGNHNQSPMPNVELSNIYHFKGKLARCNGFHGMGTDNKGNRLAWGNPTTDYSYMAGEYWAARQAHQAIYTHT